MGIERSELEVRFTTKYEEEGARAALAGLQRQIGAAKAAGEEFGHLEAKAKRLSDSIAKMGESGKGGGGMLSGIKEEISSLVGGFGEIGKIATGALAGVAAAFAAVAGSIELCKKGVEEFAQAEEKVAGLDASLAQTGQLTDEYREKLQELADQMQETTGVADDKWLDVLTRLTQFGADSTNIEKYTDGVKNLAGLMGGDVQSAAHLLSRAMQGNFEAFGRYGIVVEDAGTKSEKLDKLMQQLATRGGGQLEASNRTLSGQWRQLTNVANDFLKAIGGIIASSGILQSALNALIVAFDFWAKVLGSVIPKVEGLNNAAAKSAASLDDAEKAAKQYALNLTAIKEAADAGAASLEKQIAKVHALARAQDELLDAKMAQALAKIDQQEERGKLTPEGAIRLRGAARTSFGAARELAQDQALKTEKEMLEKKIEANKTQMMELDKQAITEEYKTTDQEELEKKRAALDKTKTAQVEYAQLRLNEFNRRPSDFSEPTLGIKPGARSFNDEDRIRTKLQKELNARTAEREKALNDLQKSDSEQSARAKAKRAEATAGQDAMAGQNTKAQERIDEIDAALAQGQAKRSITRKTDSMTTETAAEKAQKEAQKKIEEENKRKFQEETKRANEGNPLPVSSINAAGQDVVAAVDASNQSILDAFERVVQKLGELSTRLDNQRNV